MKYSPFSLSRVSRFFPRHFPVATALGLLLNLVSAHPVVAQTITLGKVFCNLHDNMANFGDLFTAIAYIVGAFCIGNGFFEIVRHHDNPRERPIHHPLVRISAGSALMALPFMMQTLLKTFYTTPASGGGDACKEGTVTSSANGVGLDVLITNLVHNIKDPLATAVSVLAVVIGIFMVVRGLIKAAKYNSDPRAHSMTHILSNLGVGAMLIVVGQTMDMLLSTVFGGGLQAANIKGSTITPGAGVVGQWQFVTQLGAGAQFTNAIAAALMFFQLIGLIAFVRGWMILKNAAEGSGQATIAQGITHIIGGTLALNIFNFLEIMDKTFGTNLL